MSCHRSAPVAALSAALLTLSGVAAAAASALVLALTAIAAASVLMLALPAAAQAAPPANDAPAGATAFSAVSAENGAVAEREGLAELAEATPDAGAPRCLGARSFARTVWFRVPAASAPQLVRVEGTGPSGASADVPDLAAYVQPAAASAAAPLTAEPQACDGAAAGGAATSADPAAAVELRVPAGRDVLVQAGRSEGQSERIVLDLRTEALEALPGPIGDEATFAPVIARERAVAVPLGGATLTQEDPAQPRCAAAGTVWRRVNAKRDGTHTITVRGDAVGALTAFVGQAPRADNALACANRTSRSAPLSVSVPAKRRDVIWVRLGTEAMSKDAAARVTVASPAPEPRFGLTLLGSRKVARLRTVRARVSVSGAAVRRLVLRLQRRAGRRFVTVAVGRAAAVTRSGRKVTVTLERTRRLRRGAYRLRVEASPVEANGRPARASGRTIRLR